jgi:tetratricopeptide (TPR) repeat protein
MKRFLAAAILVVIGNALLAQGAKVLNAYNYLQDGELVKAMNEIEPATTNEKTGIDGKTWYYRGQIYEQLYFSTEEKYAQHKEGSLLKAVESFAKAIELGSKRINMNDVHDRYARLGAFCYQEGVNLFQAENYAGAMKYFLTCNSVRESGGGIDSGAIYSAGVAAMNGGLNDDAIKLFERSISVGYNIEDSYINLANVYKGKGDDAGYKATLAKAREALPNSQEIITAEINIYLESQEYDKALANLDVAIQNDPGNALLYFVRGNIYDNKQATMMGEGKTDESVPFFDKARADYKKALELKPAYFDAAYSLGAIYYNRGAEMLNVANNISDDKLYKAAKEKAEVILKEALPYLEKAHEMNPQDMSTMTSLKELYARTNQMDKYKAMSEKLSN